MAANPPTIGQTGHGTSRVVAPTPRCHAPDDCIHPRNTGRSPWRAHLHSAAIAAASSQQSEKTVRRPAAPAIEGPNSPSAEFAAAADALPRPTTSSSLRDSAGSGRLRCWQLSILGPDIVCGIRSARRRRHGRILSARTTAPHLPSAPHKAGRRRHGSSQGGCGRGSGCCGCGACRHPRRWYRRCWCADRGSSSTWQTQSQAAIHSGAP
jgi:hypothetical protein